MFLGHLPAGYLCSKFLLRYREFPTAKRNTFLALGLIGSIAPDLDMFYFYLVDHRQHWHHSYFTHWPSFWLSVVAISWFAGRLMRDTLLTYGGSILGVNAVIHLALDTHVGRIRWLEPFSDRWIFFFNVPSLYHPKILNFVFHWTFVFEFALVVSAIYVFTKNCHVDQVRPQGK
jgi:LexA-binding, inner membrane-associated putative hydrolase